ncbi:MAG: M10 family metallopeptidase C-terminal domain-containing protein [Alphaproteobacteria bacterium]|nr:M10 family metallopeptidase C-terminal domain-containing protein [Alphaproteobacteria bacterium]
MATITGSTGNDTLTSINVADTLIGGRGNDTYIIDDAGDEVVELAGEGTDTVRASVAYVLANEVENLVLVSGSGNIDGTGNALKNTVTGNEGHNTLDGGAGADALVGGLGDDTYIVDLLASGTKAVKLEDKVTEAKNAGNDTLALRTAGALGLAQAATVKLASNIENLDASGTGSNLLNLTGNNDANTLTGNDAGNTLDGGKGADVLIGGLGDDVYVFDDAGDSAVENAGEGNDLIRINYKNASKTVPVLIDMNDYPDIEGVTVAGTGLFNITATDDGNTMTGNSSVNTITGGNGNDVLDGGTGADRMEGGAGDDTYFVDNTGDVIVDTAGTDEVRASISYTLAADFENLVLTGTGAINGTGNALDNSITGNAGNNSLDGGAGADVLAGGKGNDTYVVDDAGDSITELAGEGTDTVRTQMTHTLGANLENLVLTGSANVNGFGNALVNTITGNSGNNTLDGAAGADALIGGAGDDVYVVDLLSSGGKSIKLEDKITEAKNGGIDTLQLRLGGGFSLTKPVTFTLQNEVEKLDASATLSETINFKGNALSNIIIGNDAGTTIDGAAGNDILYGGDGNDTLLGGAGNDHLFGQAGADVLTGGAGRDRYFYEQGADSTLAETDRVTDFNISEDRITLEQGAGYTVLTGSVWPYEGAVADTVAEILLSGIGDAIYFFTDGVNGYVYVNGDGNGAVGYDGLLVQLNGRTAAPGTDIVEQAVVFESEGTRVLFNRGDAVVGSLSAFGDADEFVIDTGSSGQLTIDFNAPTNYMPSQPAYKVSVRTLDGGIVMEWTAGGDRTFTVPVEDGDYVVRIEGYQSSRFSADEYSFTSALFAHTSEDFGDTVTGTISAPGQVVSYSYDLDAGQLYTFNLSPVGVSLDLKIRIFDPTGREVFVKDDTMYFQADEGDAMRLDPNGGFVAPVSGDYTVTVEAINTPNNPIKEEITNTDGNYVDYSGVSQTGQFQLVIDEIDLEDMAARIIQGARWDSGDVNDRGVPVVINYSFDAAISADMQANSGFLTFVQMNTYKAFSTAQQQVVRDVMAAISKVAGVTFNEVAAGTGDLNFGWTRATDAGLGDGAAFLFDESGDVKFIFDDQPAGQFTIGSAFVTMHYSSGSPTTQKLDTPEMKFVLAHEILHALGLQHAGVYDDGYGPQVGVQEGMDNTAYSLLSYMNKIDSSLFPSEPQLLDILALQTLYGAPASANAGDTTYDFNSKTVEYLQAIVDTGGNDTIDASGQTLGSVIHLQDGAISSIGIIGKIADVSASDLAKVTTPGEFADQARYNIAIAPGSVIENAIGGSGNDYISGNDASNLLRGGAGSDMLLGEDGDDMLFGGLGADILSGGDGADRFVFDNLDGVDTVTDFDDSDGDVLEIGDLLSGFDVLDDDIADFVRLSETGDDTKVEIRTGGTGDWVHLATLAGATGLGSAQDLLDDGNLGVNPVLL